MGRGMDFKKMISLVIIVVGILYFKAQISWALRSVSFIGSFETIIILLLIAGCVITSK